MPYLILLRHGQSLWNEKNLFTGWVDIPLSAKGFVEAKEAGKKIADLPIDIIFISSLCRAGMTALIAMMEHKSGKVPLMLHQKEGKMEQWSKVYNEEALKDCIPMFSSWKINERMYGELQGLNKKETMDKYGEEQVRIWRRSYDIAPPGGESLEMTAGRSIPYFKEAILPHLKEGKNVFICAHGNSLRSIIMDIEGMSKEEILHFELATGEPRIYSYDEKGFRLFL
jgi:2,3-bisphosphoglycerate-dependent phosphoglycerate mutase